MKPAPFAYVRPGEPDDALAEVERDGAKVIAGGQSLVPVLAMRLARPTTLVDINAVAGFADVSTGDGYVRLGAAVRQRVAQSDDRTTAVPLLRMALPWVGHRELRSRGTVCGSLAHADPAAELPAVACCLRATVTVASTDGERSVDADDFFAGPMTTTLAPEEIVTAVTFPTAGDADGYGFAELARRHGDFALAGVAVHVNASADHARPSARVTCFGVADTAVSQDLGEDLSAAVAPGGPDLSENTVIDRLSDAVDELAGRVVTTGGDEHGSAAYRRQVIAALTARELARAYGRATGRRLTNARTQP